MSSIYFTVTNNLSYDQRMIRICTSLATAGYKVTLVGRKEKTNPPLQTQPFLQKRLNCFFKKGKLFYIEYNARLLFYLLFKKMDCICAIDLDTILPCLLISKLKNTNRVYDAHELFCEMKEIVSRPKIYKFWKRIEKYAVPQFSFGYTVNQPIADEFNKMYGVDYGVIRSISKLKTLTTSNNVPEKYFLYQGAVNEGRSFETLIPAMQNVTIPLWICGDGNFITQAKELVAHYKLESNVIFKGKLLPEDLWTVSNQAYAGITIFDDDAKSNYFSLANRFFDYMHAGIPQICVSYPVYQTINENYGFAFMINDVKQETINQALNQLLTDSKLYNELKQKALIARQELNWQQEEKLLIAFYKKLFN